MTTLKQLESSRLVRPHKSSLSEIETLLAVVERNLSDAAVSQLSDDGRFYMAYSAAFQLSTIALLASGFQAHGDDHHKVTFSTLPATIGSHMTFLADYFERCRRKRNNIQYDQVNVATKSETEELYKESLEFRTAVLDWLSNNHPKLTPGGKAS